MKNLIEKLIEIKIKIKAKFLFCDEIIVVSFNDEKNKNSILIGNLNKVMVFNTNIFIKFINSN